MEDKILIPSSKLISLVKIFHNRIGSAVSGHILEHGCKGKLFQKWVKQDRNTVKMHNHKENTEIF